MMLASFQGLDQRTTSQWALRMAPRWGFAFGLVKSETETNTIFVTS